jgi:hypothetical protein
MAIVRPVVSRDGGHSQVRIAGESDQTSDAWCGCGQRLHLRPKGSNRKGLICLAEEASGFPSGLMES